jgi:hypothetical protein
VIKRQRAPVGTVSLHSVLAAGSVPVSDRRKPGPSSGERTGELGNDSPYAVVT